MQKRMSSSCVSRNDTGARLITATSLTTRARCNFKPQSEHGRIKRSQDVLLDQSGCERLRVAAAAMSTRPRKPRLAQNCGARSGVSAIAASTPSMAATAT